MCPQHIMVRRIEQTGERIEKRTIFFELIGYIQLSRRKSYKSPQLYGSRSTKEQTLLPLCKSMRAIELELEPVVHSQSNSRIDREVLATSTECVLDLRLR